MVAEAKMDSLLFSPSPMVHAYGVVIIGGANNDELRTDAATNRFTDTHRRICRHFARVRDRAGALPIRSNMMAYSATTNPD